MALYFLEIMEIVLADVGRIYVSLTQPLIHAVPVDIEGPLIFFNPHDSQFLMKLQLRLSNLNPEAKRLELVVYRR